MQSFEEVHFRSIDFFSEWSIMWTFPRWWAWFSRRSRIWMNCRTKSTTRWSTRFWTSPRIRVRLFTYFPKSMRFKLQDIHKMTNGKIVLFIILWLLYVYSSEVCILLKHNLEIFNMLNESWRTSERTNIFWINKTEKSRQTNLVLLRKLRHFLNHSKISVHLLRFFIIDRARNFEPKSKEIPTILLTKMVQDLTQNKRIINDDVNEQGGLFENYILFVCLSVGLQDIGNLFHRWHYLLFKT